MSKRQIRKLLERQYAEEKEALLRRIDAELGLEPTERRAGKPKNKRSPKFWKILSACVSAACVLVIGLGLGLGLTLNKSDTPEIVEHYYGFEDCEMAPGEYTLKQYAELYQSNLLYLDWYDEAEDYGKILYTLKESGEAVCVKEYFADANENYIYIYITDNRTEFDSLTWYDSTTGGITTINGISVYYQVGQESALNFEYKGYRYYLQLEIDDMDYLLQIAEEMLSNI